MAIKRHSPATIEKMKASLKATYENGRVAWNKGKKLSPEHIEKLRVSHTGKKQSQETVRRRIESMTGKKRSEEFKKKQSKNMTGENNHRWRGGVSTERIKISNTPEYNEWRDAVFTRDDYTCQKCGKRGCKLNADHIIPYFKNKKLLLDINNGQTLCVSCHRKKTTREMRENWQNQYTNAEEYNNRDNSNNSQCDSNTDLLVDNAVPRNDNAGLPI